MKTKIFNVLVVSGLPYLAAIFATIDQNPIITLEKQLSWSVKAFFNKRSFNFSAELNANCDMLSIRLFLAIESQQTVRKKRRSKNPISIRKRIYSYQTQIFLYSST